MAHGIEPGIQYAQAASRKGVRVVQSVLTEEIAAQLGMFDAVLLVHVLEHLADPEEMLQIAGRLLVPGGTLYCEAPNDFNELQEAAVSHYGMDRWWITFPDHLNYFSILTLGMLLETQGFDVLTETSDFPIELFLLWGENYVGNAPLGHWAHERRCWFEEALRDTGKGDLLRDLYRSLAELGIGRKAIICARKS
jgi:SAM-dependent methyltransferase